MRSKGGSASASVINHKLSHYFCVHGCIHGANLRFALTLQFDSGSGHQSAVGLLQIRYSPEAFPSNPLFRKPQFMPL